jgi:hypothetical protein
VGGAPSAWPTGRLAEAETTARSGGGGMGVGGRTTRRPNGTERWESRFFGPRQPRAPGSVGVGHSPAAARSRGDGDDAERDHDVEQDLVDCHCCRASNLGVCDPTPDKQPPCHAALLVKTCGTLFSCRLRLTSAKRFSRHRGCRTSVPPLPRVPLHSRRRCPGDRASARKVFVTLEALHIVPCPAS